MYIKFAQMRQRSQEEKGFTLVELMVVLAVLGVILAIVTPNLLATLDKSKDEADHLTAKRLTGYVNQYHALKGEYPDAIGGDAGSDTLVGQKFITSVPTSESGGSFSLQTVNGVVTAIHVDGN